MKRSKVCTFLVVHVYVVYWFVLRNESVVLFVVLNKSQVVYRTGVHFHVESLHRDWFDQLYHYHLQHNSSTTRKIKVNAKANAHTRGNIPKQLVIASPKTKEITKKRLESNDNLP